MADLIYRQAAIDQLHQSYNLLDAEQRLEDLPTAQPEIIRCKDCKHRYGSICDWVDFWLKDEDFCSKGERKENG